VDVYYDIRGTIERYVRSCQPLSECTHLTTGRCTKGKCCSQTPDRCLCRPGNDPFIAWKLYHISYRNKYNVWVLQFLCNAFSDVSS